MIRPILLASVPNHIDFVGAWKCMCRMLPLTVFTEKNFSVFGSKPTSCLSGPVSENHRRPWSSLVSAYGREPAPPGACHSFASPVLGLIRPRKPRGSSTYHIIPSGVVSMRRDLDASFACLNGVTLSVLGSIRTSVLVRNSAAHGYPSLSMTMPYGL